MSCSYFLVLSFVVFIWQGNYIGIVQYLNTIPEKIKNKAGYMATPVACGWAGAIFELTLPNQRHRFDAKHFPFCIDQMVFWVTLIFMRTAI